MSKELQELHARVERLRPILNRAYGAYKILRELDEFPSREKYDRELADDHRRMLLAYQDFFDRVRTSLELDIHIQLAKVLIDNQESLQLRQLVRYARSEDRKIVKAKNEDGFIDSVDFAAWYASLTLEQLDEIKVQMEIHEWLISKLELVRNKKLVHENKRDTPAECLTLDEMMKLIKLSQFILDQVSYTYGSPDLERIRVKDASIIAKHLLDRLYTTY